MNVRFWRIALGVWLVLIFLFSSSLFSSDNTEKVLVFSWLNYAVRKGSHVVEYAILVYLWFRSLYVVRERFSRSVVLSVILSVLYAASDEWHQSFVPNRDGTVTDVIWDASGAVLMALFLWFIYQRGTDKVKRKMLGLSTDEDVYNT